MPLGPLAEAVLTIWAISGALLAMLGAPTAARWTYRRMWRWRWHVRPVNLEQMPGHPERVPPVGFVDDPFRAIAGQLLDDGMAGIADKAGWLR